MIGIEKYRQLVNKAKEYYESGDVCLKNISSGKNKFDLLWCPGLDKEINMWTYWQGGSRLDNGEIKAEILLVGQDWGACKDNDDFLRQYVGFDAPLTTKYVGAINGNTNEKTDHNLIELFDYIGYPAKEENPALFFTNLCLGYRSTSKISGGNLSVQMRHDSEYLKELICILKPKVVICLGASTSISAVKGLVDEDELDEDELKSYKKQIRQLGSSFNKALDNGKNWFSLKADGHNYRLYAVAHTGFMGMSNRNRASKNGKKSADIEFMKKLMKADWTPIKEYLGKV